MLGTDELKENIQPEADRVECPVRGCRKKVTKMKKGDPKSLDSYLKRRKTNEATQKFAGFFCAEHRIFVTPSTFIYEDLKDNLLWYEGKDKEVLDKILKEKRVKAQLYHDNSEDAVSWNVFRFLERNNLIEDFLSSITGTPIKSSEVIYWSYSQKEDNSWSELNKARKEFGEEIKRGSEPDIIIKTDKALFFIEAKLTAANRIDFDRSHTAKDKEERIARYSRGDRFLKLPFGDILDDGFYELGRFWVIGCSIAERLNLDFYLINLVLSEREEEIEDFFKKHIEENERRKFMRVTWERIYEYIYRRASGEEKDIMIRFFKNKTLGYNGKGELQPAFSVAQEKRLD